MKILEFTKSNLSHFYLKSRFQITGLSDFILILKRMGIYYTVDNLLEIGMTQLFFSDPVGNCLEANFVNETLRADS